MENSSLKGQLEEVLAAEVDFTEKAARRVGELMLDEEEDNLMLRIFITGGGCSGFQYGFTFTHQTEEGDLSVKSAVNPSLSNGKRKVDQVELLIDPMSYQYLAGSKIDFKDDIEGAQFVIDNPNAVTTCGCGSSFRTE